MPVYDFRCKACGHTDEYVKSFNDDEVPDCDVCDTPMTQLVSLWAKTPGSWGDTNGYFYRGLGCYVKNFSPRDKLMKEKGLRPVSDQELDESQHAVYSEHKQHLKDVSKFEDNMKKTGDFNTSVNETFKHEELLQE